MKTLTHEELTEVAGGWGPSYKKYYGNSHGFSVDSEYELYVYESFSLDVNYYDHNYAGHKGCCGY